MAAEAEAAAAVAAAAAAAVGDSTVEGPEPGHDPGPGRDPGPDQEERDGHVLGRGSPGHETETETGSPPRKIKMTNGKYQISLTCGIKNISCAVVWTLCINRTLVSHRYVISAHNF